MIEGLLLSPFSHPSPQAHWGYVCSLICSCMFALSCFRACFNMCVCARVPNIILQFWWECSTFPLVSDWSPEISGGQRSVGPIVWHQGSLERSRKVSSKRGHWHDKRIVDINREAHYGSDKSWNKDFRTLVKESRGSSLHCQSHLSFFSRLIEHTGG